MRGQESPRKKERKKGVLVIFDKYKSSEQESTEVLRMYMSCSPINYPENG